MYLKIVFSICFAEFSYLEIIGTAYIIIRTIQKRFINYTNKTKNFNDWTRKIFSFIIFKIIIHACRLNSADRKIL